MDSNGEPLVAKVRASSFFLSFNSIHSKVWPADNCFFPDYTNPVTQKWWEERIAEFQTLLPWDGLWIDMNEPANFVDGSATVAKKMAQNIITFATFEKNGSKYYYIGFFSGLRQQQPQLPTLQASHFWRHPGRENNMYGQQTGCQNYQKVANCSH